MKKITMVLVMLFLVVPNINAGPFDLLKGALKEVEKGLEEIVEVLEAPAASEKGCMKGDCQNGIGTYKFAGQGTYEGEHKNGKGHGQGTRIYADGSKYVGEHNNDKANGQGTHIYADGSKYVGEWKNGKPNGQGTHTSIDGSTKTGTWKDFNYVTADQIKEDKAKQESEKARESLMPHLLNYAAVKWCNKAYLIDDATYKLVYNYEKAEIKKAIISGGVTGVYVNQASKMLDQTFASQTDIQNNEYCSQIKVLAIALQPDEF